jgi:hypothetical protein
MYAYQWWADTTTGLLKIRNAANSAWVTIGTLASANLGLLPLAGGTMTGVLAVTAGTAALPGIAVSGDPNTGIYSPGADQIGIATGGTARITVDSSGNVGIGVVPSAQYSTIKALQVGALGATVIFGNTSAGGTSGFGQNFYSDPSTADTKYAASSYPATSYHQYNGEHRWFRAPSGTAGNTITFTQAMTLDASGRLGIGTISPTRPLHVAGSAVFSDTVDTTVWAQFSSGVGGIGTNNNYPFAFAINGTERGRWDTSGRLLVGTIASPAHQLQVSTDSAGKPSTSTWTIVSDERIKEDIELADLDLCYEAIKAIPLKRYKWRDEIYTAEQVTDRRKLGWIAQDVEAVFPKAVGTHEFKYNQVFEETIIPAVGEELDADGNVITPAQPERTEQGDLISEDVIEDCRNLNSDQIYAAMYGAVQKLMAKVETLETSNADLLARVTALEAA